MASTVKNCYLIINGKKYGPVSEQDILRLYEQNKINGKTKYAKPGAKEWIPLSESGIIESDLDIDDLPPLPGDGKSKKKIKPGVLVLSIIFVVLGIIAMFYGISTLLG